MTFAELAALLVSTHAVAYGAGWVHRSLRQ